MRIHITESTQQKQQNQMTQSGNTGRARIRIHAEQEQNELEKQELQAELEMVREELAEARAQLENLQNELSVKEAEFLELMKQSEMHNKITEDDLEDKDSVIEELRARNEELEQLIQKGNEREEEEREEEIRQMKQEAEVWRQEKEAAQGALTAFMERENVILLPQMLTYGTPTEGQKIVMQKYERFSAQLREEEGSCVVSTTRLEELTQEIEEYVKRAENLKRQLEEVKEEEGKAFQELQEIKMRYQQDLRYVEFYEKIPEKKIDGLEVFRVQIDKLDRKLSEILDKGLRTSYVFRSNSLLNELEENKNRLADILRELQNLVENYEFDGTVENDDMKSTEEYRRQARENLKELEKTLRDMYMISEKFLQIKNMIGFGYDSY